jgi:hypothetical protein
MFCSLGCQVSSGHAALRTQSEHAKLGVKEVVMNAIVGTPEEVLEQVQAIVERQVPHAVCELQDYKENIACAARDPKGTLREIKWAIKGLNEWRVDNQAQALASWMQPRARRIRGG